MYHTRLRYIGKLGEDGLRELVKRVVLTGLILCLLLPLTAFGRQGGQKIRVGYFDYEGFLEKSKNGGYTGYGFDYLNEISSYLGWEYEFVYGSWEECLDRLAKGEIDLLCTAQYSEDRARLFEYAKFSSGSEYATLLVRKDNQDVYYNDYESFDGLRVGFMVNSYQNGLFEEFSRLHGFTYVASYYTTSVELKQALDQGEVDAMLTGSLQKVMGEKAVAKFSPEPFYFITTKGNTGLMDQLNGALEAIQTNDVDFNSKLYSKYYGEASASQPAFTRQEAAYIKAHPVLKVAYDPEWSPLSYMDSETKQFAGVFAGVMELLSERSTIRFEFIPVEAKQGAVGLLQAGEVDLICGVDERDVEHDGNEKIALTKSFFEVPITFSLLDGLNFDDIQTIAIPQNCQSIIHFAQERYPDSELSIYPDTESCMIAVSGGRADAVLENIYVLDQYSKDQDFTNVQPVLSAEALIPVCIGMRRDEDLALRTLFNKLITQLDSRETDEILIRNTAEGPHLHLGGWLRRYIGALIAFVFLAILVVVLHSRRQISKYAFEDSLTGYANETRFLLTADKMRKDGEIEEYFLVSLDIDKFKFINNIYGYRMGNKVLMAVADEIARAIHPGELFCRQANDHYLLMLLKSRDEENKRRLEALLQRIVNVPAGLQEHFQYTASMGVYMLSDEDLDLHQAIGWANLAREKGKDSQKSSLVYYDDSMRLQAIKEQKIAGHMEEALAANEFTVYYQPKVLLDTGEIVGAEALVRWILPGSVIVPPDDFVPLFERNGFIIQLDLYVFEQVCIQLRKWLDQGLDPPPVSVNVSRVHLSQPDFYIDYFDLMRKYEIDSDYIEIEITESTIFENKYQVSELFKQLKRRGLLVSMDDFGAGYSSLNLLKDLPFDYLKLDKEFLNLASDTTRGQEVIRCIIDMAMRLQMIVVAEGVETQEQAEFLKKSHCQIAQGYLYSKPLPVGEYEKTFSE